MITSIDKALVAVIMAVIFFANEYLNAGLTVDPALVNQIVAVATPILVWAIPNRKV